MAESITVTETRKKYGSSGEKEGHEIKVAWTSAADGSVSQTLTLPGGYIHNVVTVPSATAAPTADYDISLYHYNGTSLDVLGTKLNDRHTSSSEIVQPVRDNEATPVFIFQGDYTFTVANAGDSKSGTCYFEIADE